MKKLLLLIPLLLLAGCTAEPNLGAFGDPFLSLQVGTTASNNDVLVTDGTDSTWSSSINLSAVTTTQLYITGVAANSWLATKGISKVIATSTQPLSEVPAGTVNGANTVFTLTKVPADTDDLILNANGSVLRNGTDFTLSGKTITFTIAPETGWLLFAHYQAYPSGLQFGLNSTVVTKTTDYTILNSDGTILMDNSSVATTTLPTAVGVAGKIFVVKKINSASVKVVIDGLGSETVDSALTAKLTIQYESMQFISNGSNWFIF